jgi:hypothetical protein
MADNPKQSAQDEPAANEGWTKQTSQWPTLPVPSAGNDAQLASAALSAFGALIGGAVGLDVARSLIGSVGWRDEFVALFFGTAGVGIARQFALNLCHARPRGWQGVPSAVAAGLGLGLGVVTLAAATLTALLDGGILAISVIGPAGARLIANSRGGTKTCPHCHKKQSCKHAVCRSCLRIFFPQKEISPDAFYVDWFAVASFLDEQGLNYFEARRFIIENYSGPIVHGKVDCEDFRQWAHSNKKRMLDYIGTIAPSAQRSAELDRLGV